MSAPQTRYAFSIDAARQAGEDYRANGRSREAKLRAVEKRQYDRAEPRDRLAKRANRLLDHVRRTSHGRTEGLSPALADLVAAGPLSPEQVDNVTFERIIGETR